jgi:hypothetical protein
VKKGIPRPHELGPRDLERGTVALARRDHPTNEDGHPRAGLAARSPPSSTRCRRGRERAASAPSTRDPSAHGRTRRLHAEGRGEARSAASPCRPGAARPPPARTSPTNLKVTIHCLGRRGRQGRLRPLHRLRQGNADDGGGGEELLGEGTSMTKFASDEVAAADGTR